MNKNNNKQTKIWEHLVTEYAVIENKTAEMRGTFTTYKEVVKFLNEYPNKCTIYKLKTFKHI